LTNQTTDISVLAMVNPQMKRSFDAYPTIYLACHRRHVRDDERGEVVTAHQASILDHLDAQRPTTLSSLAEHMGVGRSAMSIQVKRLVRRGYIRKRAAQQDDRKLELTLTHAGSRIQEQNTVLDPDLVRELFALIPATELESALAGVEQLAKYARVLMKRRRRRFQ
jgi:MarR family transcriptional regulator, organic hydroperoxide resistance regulator